MAGCAASVQVIAPDKQTWEVVGIPSKGSVTFEKGMDESKVKIVVETKGGPNPFKAFLDVITGAVALVFSKTDVQVPVD